MLVPIAFVFIALPLVSPPVAELKVATTRSLVTLQVAVTMLVDYKLHLGQRPEETTAEYSQRKSELHLRAATTLLTGLRRNGGIYVKLGQHLSALVYLLPVEYTDTLRVLQSEAPRSSLAQVQQVFREDWGGSFEDYFSSFDPEPLGSASLAQVHRATVKGSGQEVAVKVQHEGLDRFAAGDIKTVALAVKAIKYFFPELDFDWLADELRTNLPLEMDFVNEGRNAARAARNFGLGGGSSSVVIPAVYWPLTSHRILTMEFTPGRPVTDTEYLQQHGINQDHVAVAVTQVFAEMIFCHGFVHADPHGGNIFVRPKQGGRPGDFELVLLDHGLYREVERDVRLHYAGLWEAIISGNEKGINLHSHALGAGHLYQLFSTMLTSRLW